MVRGRSGRLLVLNKQYSFHDCEATDKHHRSFLAACLDHTPLLHHPDLRQRCLFHILEGRQCYAMILLILIIPNLTSFNFCLRNEWDAELLTTAFTSAIMSSKLSAVSCYHWDTEFFTPIEKLLIFALCPTVRILEGEMAGAQGFDPAHIPGWENAISNVEKIHLSNGVLDDGDMENILQPMKNLKAFYYEGTWFSLSHEALNLQFWIDTLVEVCGQRLEALTITLEQRAKVNTFKGLQVSIYTTKRNTSNCRAEADDSRSFRNYASYRSTSHPSSQGRKMKQPLVPTLHLVTE